MSYSITSNSSASSEKIRRSGKSAATARISPCCPSPPSSRGKTRTTSGRPEPSGTGSWPSTASASPSRTRSTRATMSSWTDNSSAQNTSARTASPRRPRPRSSRSSGAYARIPCAGSAALRRKPRQRLRTAKLEQRPATRRFDRDTRKPSGLGRRAFSLCAEHVR
jgi:hypothetical protein